MEWTDRNPEAVSALVQALNAMTDLFPDNTADTGKYRYSYVDLASVLQQARQVLSQHGWAVTQEAFAERVEGGTKDRPFVSQVMVATHLLHTSGALCTHGPLSITSADEAQPVGSAITYARRYALMAALGIASDDDDGAAANRSMGRGRPQASAAPSAGDQARAMLARLPRDVSKAMREAFVAEWGAAMSELHSDKQPMALLWLRQQIEQQSAPAETASDAPADEPAPAANSTPEGGYGYGGGPADDEEPY